MAPIQPPSSTTRRRVNVRLPPMRAPAEDELFAACFDSVENPAIVVFVSTDRGIKMDDTPLIEQATDAINSAAETAKEAVVTVIKKVRRAAKPATKPTAKPAAKVAAKPAAKAQPKQAAKAKKVATKTSAKKATKKTAKHATKKTAKKASKKTTKKAGKKAKKG